MPAVPASAQNAPGAAATPSASTSTSTGTAAAPQGHQPQSSFDSIYESYNR
jgi:hypothetical protein